MDLGPQKYCPHPPPPSRISPHPEVTHYLLGLFENPGCLCAQVPCQGEGRVLTQDHCQPELSRIPYPGISSNNPGPFHLSATCKPRGLSPLQATTRLGVVIRHPQKRSQPPLCRPHLHLSSSSLPPYSGAWVPEDWAAHTAQGSQGVVGDPVPSTLPRFSPRPRWPLRRSPWPDAPPARGGRCG